ncbi:hypothetical protein [Gaetbulibacter jejuensis]|uniref:hypothetical protein n=1 Tax=Gaetbulibacter jejuensis TaxID=584607 RepID=UPI00300859F2
MKYDIITEESAKKSNKNFGMALGVMASEMDSIERKEFLKSDAHNVMMVEPKNDSILLEAFIYPKCFWDAFYDGKVVYGKGIYTNRDSLYQCSKRKDNLDTPCTRKTDVIYKNESKYKIEYFPNDKKEILGYNCFKILATRLDSTHTLEIYATKDIILNYNPILKFKSLNNKYYVLEYSRIFSHDKGNILKYKAVSIDLD